VVRSTVMPSKVFGSHLFMIVVLLRVFEPVQKTENTDVGIRHADHVGPSTRKMLAITSPTSRGRSVGIVRSRTQTMEFIYFIYLPYSRYIPLWNLASFMVSNGDFFRSWGIVTPRPTPKTRDYASPDSYPSAAAILQADSYWRSVAKYLTVVLGVTATITGVFCEVRTERMKLDTTHSGDILLSANLVAAFT
jgi:hypothetical protein